MKLDSEEIGSFIDFVTIIEDSIKSRITYYRGQCGKYPLLPALCRNGASEDVLMKEKQILDEFKRRSDNIIHKKCNSDLEWMIYAQHFGLHTRLLDWTTNPLVALWFACQKEPEKNGYVYVFCPSLDFFSKDGDNTKNGAIDIVKPLYNNERIVAQSGWFTIHSYPKTAKAFVAMDQKREITKNMFELIIPASQKKNMMANLDKFGINYQSMFPDVSGLCSYLNWLYQE